MGKRNLLAYFQTMEQAQKAVDALQEQGLSEVDCERIAPMLGGNPYDEDEEITGVIERETNSLATMTLGSPILNDDEGILAATHPDASGFAGGTGFDHPADVLVTVVTDDKQYEQTKMLLKQYGAEI